MAGKETCDRRGLEVSCQLPPTDTTTSIASTPGYKLRRHGATNVRGGTWNFDVHHLLLKSHMCTEVRINYSAPDSSLRHFVIRPCRLIKSKCEGKGYPRTGSTTSLTSALDGMGGDRHARPLYPRHRDQVPIV